MRARRRARGRGGQGAGGRVGAAGEGSRGGKPGQAVPARDGRAAGKPAPDAAAPGQAGHPRAPVQAQTPVTAAELALGVEPSGAAERVPWQRASQASAGAQGCPHLGGLQPVLPGRGRGSRGRDSVLDATPARGACFVKKIGARMKSAAAGPSDVELLQPGWSTLASGPASGPQTVTPFPARNGLIKAGRCKDRL